MKKLFSVFLAFALSATSVFAGSYNSLSRSNIVVRDESSIAFVNLIIEPKNEVDTGSSIFLNFENATVFDQDVLDGNCTDKNAYGYNSTGYQYLINGTPWNVNDGFFSIMPNLNSAQLPYHLKKITDKQLQVDLINLPDVYANSSLSRINGIGRTPYYSIPLAVYADGIGEIKMSIDSNGSSISDGMVGSASIYENNDKDKSSSTTSTTESSTETTTINNVDNTGNSNETKGKNVKIQIGAYFINVDGENISIDVPAYIQTASQSTLVPLRAVSNAFVGNDSVSWNANTKTAEIRFNGNIVSFTANADNMMVNGVSKPMPDNVRAEITNGRMFVPFRVLGESMGLNVDWDGNSKTAIYSDK